MSDFPKTVFGILPVFYRPSPDNWGHTKGPVVYLPLIHQPHLTAHEVHHVKQFYVALILGVLTFGLFAIWMSRRRFESEAAAYGASVRAGKLFEDAATALTSQHYKFGRTRAEAIEIILKRVNDKRLF